MIGNAQFYFKNVKFNHYPLVSALVTASQYVFYTLSPYVFVVDFSLSSKRFAALMMIPQIESLVGRLLMAFLSQHVKSVNIIFSGVVVAVSVSLSIVFAASLSSFSPMILIVLFAVLTVSISLTTGPSRTLAVGINRSLAGFYGGLFSIVLNGVNWVFSHIASQQYSEVIGMIIFSLSLMALVVHVAFRKQ